MANVHVYIDVRDGRPRTASLEALGEGRRVSSYLGATLHAITLLPAEDDLPPDEGLVGVLGRHGADRVVRMVAPAFAQPASTQIHGAALASICESVPPLLFLGDASGASRELLPRLAARLGAAFLAEPSVEYGPQGALVLAKLLGGRRTVRRLRADELERPVVATLASGHHTIARGDTDAEVLILPAPSFPAGLDVVSDEVARNDDGAPVLVVCGGGVGAGDWPAVQAFARALGAELALTPEAARRGGVGPARVLTPGAPSGRPRLIVSLGASGSPEHLACLPWGATIVAVNKDPDAPIFRVARFGLVGELAALLPGLVAAASEKAA